MSLKSFEVTGRLCLLIICILTIIAYKKRCKNNQLLAQEITIYDLAKALNLTPATVSRALNNSYEISEKTKIKVRDMADAMNYYPNRMASSLRSNRNKMIGVLIPNIAYNFNVTAITAIEDVLAPKGYRIIICQTNEQLDREIENLKDLASIRVDGIIASLSAQTKHINHFQKILPAQTPLVFIDRVPNEEHHIKISIDNVQAAYNAVCFLIKLGKRKIAWMAGPEGLEISEMRYTGYCQAHQEAGLTIDPSLKINCLFDSHSGYRKMLEILSSRPDIDGIFSINDRVAIEALAAVRDAGKNIPEDISVIGFNNEPFSPLLYPSLTTVFQPAYEMGKESALQLLNLIKGRKPEKKDFIFKTSIIERGSTHRQTISPLITSESDLYFNAEMIDKIKQSFKEVEKGETKKVSTPDELSKMLGL